MDYICPECGYTDEARGRCPSCEVPLIPIDEVGEAVEDETDSDEEAEESEV
jgi:predicted ATP-dependent serine protease